MTPARESQSNRAWGLTSGRSRADVNDAAARIGFWTYRRAELALLALVMAYCWPIVIGRQVIFPHDNSIEVALPESASTARLQSRKFTDQSDAFVPELSVAASRDRRAWMTTWNRSVELGRPAFLLSGLSAAWLPTWLLLEFTDDALWISTLLSLLTVVLTGWFGFRLLEAKALHPVACFVGAAALSCGVFTSYWLTFMTFLAPVCWSTCLLWLVTRAARGPTLANLGGIAFASTSLLLAAYPQTVVQLAYLIVPYTALELWRGDVSWSVRMARSAAIAVAVVLGVAAALPALMDVFLTAHESTRLEQVDDEFFLAVLPTFAGWCDVSRFVAPMVDAFWHGNPMQLAEASRFNGISFGPVISALVAASLARRWRETWLWQTFVLACVVFSVWPSALLFAVHHLGFHFSRSLPLGRIILPCCVLAAYAVDTALTSPRRTNVLAVAACFAPSLASLSCLLCESGMTDLDAAYVGLSLALAASTAIAVWFRSASGLIALIVATSMLHGQALMLVRPADEIQRTSPLVDAIRQATHDGSRLAVVGWDLGRILPPNQESMLGLRSVHSYNSLSSTAFQQLAKEISATGTTAYGRFFVRIDGPAPLRADAASYCAIGAVISSTPLDAALFEELRRFDGRILSRPRTPPILAAQLVGPDTVIDRDVNLHGPLANQDRRAVRVVKDLSDYRVMEIEPTDEESILFTSTQFDPRWRATVDGRLAETVRVRGFFQGVRLPRGAKRIELTFRAFALYSWWAHLAYAMVAVAATGMLAIRLVRARRRAASVSA